MQYSDEFKRLTGINDTTLIVEREGRDPIRLDEELDLIFLSFDTGAPEPNTVTSEIVGMDGVIDKGTTYGPREMGAKFMITTYDKFDYSLLQDELFRIFDSKKPFSIIDEDRPGRRWENVKLNGKIEFERSGARVGIITIPLISFSPYAVSIGSSLDDFSFDTEKFQVGMNIPAEDISFVHSTNTFSIWNIGDVEIDPAKPNMGLQIYYKGASENLSISNLTTGDTWTYTGTSVVGDTIVLDGVFSRKNGISIFGSSSHKVIRLAPGENSFKLSGTIGSFTIKFDFKFLYL